MDRKAWTAIILSVVALVGWQWYYAKAYPPRKTPPPAAAATATPGATATATPGAITGAIPGTTPVPGATPEPPTIAARSESLYSKDAEYVFSNDKGGIERANLYFHQGENQQSVSLNGSSMPIGALGSTPGEAWGGFAMTTDSTKNEAVFTRKDADGLEITKRFSIPESDPKKGLYQLKMTLEFRNTGTADISRNNYFVSSGGAAPIHPRDLPLNTRFDWNNSGKFTTIDVNWYNAGGIPFLGLQWSPQKALYQINPEKPEVNWAGVASQYFCTIITTENTKGNSVWATRYETRKLDNAPVYGIQGGLGMPGFTLEPQGTKTESFIIYSGPKDLMQLRKMSGGQDAVMNFGMFGFVSEVLLWGMNKLQGILGSYAAAIIVLTLIIKSLLWPLQNKATNEMRRMAALSPKMTEMREKYKDDPQKMNEEMMKMYREYGVNPLSGCFPMLLQIPIFFGFYAMLGSAIQLRNSSFLWVQDLSQPDTVGHLLGFPINVLPIVMAGTMVWQMIISPKSGDAMQQRMMYFMPIVFLVFAYNYASGLALYWTTQNIFSIVQLYATRNKPLPTLEKKSDVAKRDALATKKKKKRPGQ